MIEIKDQAKFDSLVSEAIEKVALTVSDDKSAQRWINAINNAVKMIETQPEWLTYDEKENYLLIWSQDSGKVYSANGVCQCKAFEQGFPCKHRAAARLVRNYLGLEENKSPKLPKVKKEEITYLPPTTTNPKRLRIGGVWID